MNIGHTGLNTQWQIAGKERDSRETEKERWREVGCSCKRVMVSVINLTV